MVQFASVAIQAGMASVVACVWADDPGRIGASGVLGPNPMYALAPRRHMQKYGTSHKDLGYAASAAFFAGTAASEFRLRHCTGCGGSSAPQADQCEHCGSTALNWQAAVVSWTVTHSNPAEDGSTHTAVLAIAQLAEGPWWWSQIIDADPAAITVGTRLTIGFERAGPDFEAVPVFRLA
jgi:uncharacterized OB-fold protein